jgi:hypothetical protein
MVMVMMIHVVIIVVVVIPAPMMMPLVVAHHETARGCSGHSNDGRRKYHSFQGSFYGQYASVISLRGKFRPAVH